MSSAQLDSVIAKIDERNSEDPNQEVVDGQSRPRELVYSQRLTDWVRKLVPEPSEALLIAARGQHICRWTIARESYAQDRRGYLQWRETLKTFHAETVGKIMEACGYQPSQIEHVQQIIRKKQLSNPETQAVEDALCLVFLETQFAELTEKTPHEKMIEILQKTWKKMSEQAHTLALQLPLSESQKTLIQEALS